MAIKWTLVRTSNNYPFSAYRTNKGSGKEFIIAEYAAFDYKSMKSLTNNIEEIIAHILSGLKFNRGILVEPIELYQWGDGGLFRITYDFELCPHKGFNIWDVKWKYMSDNLDCFEVLYCD